MSFAHGWTTPMEGHMKHIGRNVGRSRILIAPAVAAALAAFSFVTISGEEGEQPIDFVHNVVDAPAPVTNAVFGTAPSLRPGQRICTTETSAAANVNTDFENTGPSNETSIAVNPTNA